jgi:hypothetical protein
MEWRKFGFGVTGIAWKLNGGRWF